jgi:hypothetical protein
LEPLTREGEGIKQKNENEPLVRRENDDKTREKVSKYPNGWLKNGNPPASLQNVEKCGAKSKRHGQPCKQPAMKNGRCRFHGGKSTGPKTAEGKENARLSNFKLGDYTQSIRTELKLIQVLVSTLKEITESSWL